MLLLTLIRRRRAPCWQLVGIHGVLDRERFTAPAHIRDQGGSSVRRGKPTRSAKRLMRIGADGVVFWSVGARCWR